MSNLNSYPFSAPDGPSAHPRGRMWNRAEYYKMAEVGILRPGERVELIEGEIRTVAPIGPMHRKTMITLFDLLRQAFGPGYYVMPESPIAIAEKVEPQPDVAVAVGPEEAYDSRHPEPADIRLIVEVSDTTLASDRKDKARLYAAAGIPEYWIVNVPARQVEVYRNPSGNAYRDVQIRRPGESITPLYAPHASVAVDRFIPASR